MLSSMLSSKKVIITVNWRRVSDCINRRKTRLNSNKGCISAILTLFNKMTPRHKIASLRTTDFAILHTNRTNAAIYEVWSQLESFYKMIHVRLLNITQVIHDGSFDTVEGDKTAIASTDTLQSYC